MTPGPAAAAGPAAAKITAAKAMQAIAALGLADHVKDFGATEAERQMAKRNAFRNSVRYAQQTNALMVRLQFADGQQRYVIYKDDAPIAAFPPFLGDLNDALAFHEAGSMQRLTPQEALERRRSVRTKRSVRDRMRRTKDEEDEVSEDDQSIASAVPRATGAMLALPAGDPLGEDELLDAYDDIDQ